jgi:D-serine dehydratase
MNDFLDPLLDATHKAFPQAQAPLRRSQVGAQGWNVLAGDLPLPVAVIRRTALAHNLGWMQRFADDAGVGFAPHGKTTMSPQLLAQQLRAGAWGLTFATVGQARTGAAAGARRIVIANQVLQAADLRGIDALRREFAGLRVMFLLDSEAQLDAIEAVARPPGAAPFEVLLELGLAGGRTGCRTHEDAVALARRGHASGAVALAGIECYEGPASSGDDAEDGTRVAALMDRVDAVARQCDDEGLFDADEVIVTAGGSAVFDLVVPRLRLALRRPVTGLLRSGCYLTHDHGFYRRMVGAVNRRIGCAEAAGLQGALTVWALVQSRPEPDLAILAAGKRDLSFDMGLPAPVLWCPAGGRVPQPAPPEWAITGLNDQHAYLRREGGDPALALRVGDRVALGISHPCTTFDKWRWMPVVDDAYDVVDAITTCF